MHYYLVYTFIMHFIEIPNFYTVSPTFYYPKRIFRYLNIQQRPLTISLVGQCCHLSENEWDEDRFFN